MQEWEIKQSKNNKNIQNIDKYKRNSVFLQNYNAYTINDFIHLIKNKHYEDLHQNFTWNQHFEPITNWINKTDYANIIVIVYEKNLNAYHI